MRVACVWLTFNYFSRLWHFLHSLFAFAKCTLSSQRRRPTPSTVSRAWSGQWRHNYLTPSPLPAAVVGGNISPTWGMAINILIRFNKHESRSHKLQVLHCLPGTTRRMSNVAKRISSVIKSKRFATLSPLSSRVAP